MTTHLTEEKRREVHVVATAGMSPAVLTELGWWTARHGYRVSSLRIWTTAGGQAGLNEHLDRHWDRLREDVGPDALPPRDEIDVQTLEAPDGTPLPDVRWPDDADAVAARIHREVQERTREGCLPLIGWFAGGRKTMSSALQSAFTLYGRPSDKLFHALVHPEIEALPRDVLSTFAWPTAAWAERVGVAVDCLVDVAEVPFVALTRFLVPAAVGESWEELWATVRSLEALASEIEAVLEPPNPLRERGDQVLRFTGQGEPLHELLLSYAEARFYADLVRAGEPGTGVTEDGDAQSVQRIRDRFGALQYSILAPFCPRLVARGRGYRVPAHARVRLL